MNLPLFHSLGLAALCGVAAVASHAEIATLTEGRMTYEVFEHAIEHVDLAICPSEFDMDKMFCRMTLADNRAHVFVFAHDADQPLMTVKSYDLDNGLPQF
ncbi:MAG: hypothetical protein ACU0CB_01240 [Roseovarius sp.]|uniref:hypothetical protein n=1 Tax=Roseovarius sp. TaxID=1486281 RepID=UPI002618C594|nr:hypothetical protein [Roseovarius sp.]